MKTVHRIIQQEPLVVYLTKNGRPVSMATGALYVKKEFPLIKKWLFTPTDHSLQAKEL